MAGSHSGHCNGLQNRKAGGSSPSPAAKIRSVTMDNSKKHKSREHSWHSDRSWKRRYTNDVKKFYFCY